MGNETFYWDGLMEVIQRLSSSKAAGQDNIPVRLVKDGAGIIADSPLNVMQHLNM